MSKTIFYSYILINIIVIHTKTLNGNKNYPFVNTNYKAEF